MGQFEPSGGAILSQMAFSMRTWGAAAPRMPPGTVWAVGRGKTVPYGMLAQAGGVGEPAGRQGSSHPRPQQAEKLAGVEDRDTRPAKGGGVTRDDGDEPLPLREPADERILEVGLAAHDAGSKVRAPQVNRRDGHALDEAAQELARIGLAAERSPQDVIDVLVRRCGRRGSSGAGDQGVHEAPGGVVLGAAGVKIVKKDIGVEKDAR